MVSRREYVLSADDVQAEPGSSFGDTIFVDPSQPWTSTAIQVNAGDVLTIDRSMGRVTQKLIYKKGAPR